MYYIKMDRIENFKNVTLKSTLLRAYNVLITYLLNYILSETI